MSSKSSGLFLHFDEERRSELIHERAEIGYESFSDALSVPDWEIGQLTVALLSFSGTTIDYIALAKKGKRVVTAKNRVDFHSLIDLKSIPIENIHLSRPNRLQQYLIKVSQGAGSIIPPQTWKALIEEIKTNRPTLADDIDRLMSLRRYSGYRLRGEVADILLQEREAIGIALQIFSGNNRLRDKVLREWAPFDDSVVDVNEEDETAAIANLGTGRSSFLKGISQRYFQEESAIQHDLFNWPGMTPVHEAGVSVFEQGSRKLEIHYANRNALENTLGIDLIYFNEEYKLFVLVQYKLMKEEGENILYRPEPQLYEELERMDQIYNTLHNLEAIQSHEEYRLNDDGFFMKLVPGKGLQPASGELIKGMYIPREYMHFLVGANGPKGPKGGIQISFENAPRYLTNSQFAESVHNGWIGTRGIQSETLVSILQQFYETGRAVILAFESLPEETCSADMK